jgi:segregation and condensation protein A
MANSAAATPSLEAYQLRLPVFEGPLDVLLRLIEREQLAISEVSLLVVLEQFFAFMESLDAPPPEVVAEFAAVAGRLSLLKSRSLLPQPPKQVEESDELDLVRQLEAYRALKAAAALLGQRQQSETGAYGRGDGVAAPSAEPARIAPQQPTALAKAVGRWLTRIPAATELRAIRRIVSLREMIDRIAMLFAKERRVPFDRILATCADRQEAAVAFLALLTLIRRQTIVATQQESFHPITMTRPPANRRSQSATTELEQNEANVHVFQQR